MDHDCSEISIEHGRTEGVFEATDEHRFIDEGIQRSAQSPPVRCEIGPARGWRTGHDQHLKVWPMCFRAGERGMQATRHHRFAVIMHVPIASVLPKRAGKNGPSDASGQCRHTAHIVCGAMFPQRRHQLETGISMELLGRYHLVECDVERRPLAGPARPSVDQFHQMTPLVGPRSRPREEPVDAPTLTFRFPRHRQSLLRTRPLSAPAPNAACETSIPFSDALSGEPPSCFHGTTELSEAA